MRFLSLLIVVFYSLSVFGLTGAQRLLTVQAPAGAPPYTNAHSLSFNGSTGYVIGTNHTTQDFTTAMSMSVWIKSNTSGATILDKSYPTRAGYWFDTYSGSTWGGWFFNNVSSYTARASSGGIDNTWHMITATWSSGTIKFYLDGSLDNSTTSINNNGNTTMGSNIGALIIGADQFPSVGTIRDFFTGKLTNLSLWNVVLSATDITNLMSGGKPADLSTHAQFAHCVGWYKLGDGDTTSANGILDSTANGFNMSINGGVTISTDHP